MLTSILRACSALFFLVSSFRARNFLIEMTDPATREALTRLMRQVRAIGGLLTATVALGLVAPRIVPHPVGFMLLFTMHTLLVVIEHLSL